MLNLNKRFFNLFVLLVCYCLSSPNFGGDENPKITVTSNSHILLDIDGDNQTDALTDGILILRRMFGLGDNVLISGAISENAAYTSASEIELRIDNLDGLLDVDKNENIDALTDGLLILRYLFGLTGDPMVSKVIAPSAQRSSAEEIQDYLAILNAPPPIFINDSVFAAAENQLDIGNVSANDANNNVLIYGVSGDEISISPLGSLSFLDVPDYEVKSEYSIKVTATNGITSGHQNISIYVIDLDDTAPVFMSSSVFSAEENQTSVGTVITQDVDSDNSSIAYSVSGTDLQINSEGLLNFNSSPNYERKNLYEATVTATDGTNSSTQDITIDILDLDDTVIADYFVFNKSSPVELLDFTMSPSPDGTHSGILSEGYRTGDFNGDGFEDSAMVISKNCVESVLLVNYGSVNGPSTIKTSVKAFYGGRRLAVTDLNNDGYDDLSIITQSYCSELDDDGSGYFRLLIGTSEGLQDITEEISNSTRNDFDNTRGDTFGVTDIDNDGFDELMVLQNGNPKLKEIPFWVEYENSEFVTRWVNPIQDEDFSKNCMSEESSLKNYCIRGWTITFVSAFLDIDHDGDIDYVDYAYPKDRNRDDYVARKIEGTSEGIDFSIYPEEYDIGSSIDSPYSHWWLGYKKDLNVDGYDDLITWDTDNNHNENAIQKISTYISSPDGLMLSDEWSPSYFGQSSATLRNTMDENLHFFDVDGDGINEWLVPMLGFSPKNISEETGVKSRKLTVMKKSNTGWEFTEINASDNGLPYQNPELYRYLDENDYLQYVSIYRTLWADYDNDGDLDAIFILVYPAFNNLDQIIIARYYENIQIIK